MITSYTSSNTVPDAAIKSCPGQVDANQLHLSFGLLNFSDSVPVKSPSSTFQIPQPWRVFVLFVLFVDVPAVLMR